MDLLSKTKLESAPEILCKGIPINIQLLLKYSLGLKFEQEPDYDYIKQLLFGIGDEYKFTFDGIYDWDKLKIPYKIDIKENAKTKVVKEEELYDKHLNSGIPISK